MSRSRHVSRRQFLQTTGAVAGGIATAGLAARLRAAVPPTGSQAGFSVAINSNNGDRLLESSAPAPWAINHLREALAAKGVALRPQADLTINLVRDLKLDIALVHDPEALALVPASRTTGQSLEVHYADASGLVYALTELADRVRLSPDPRAALTLAAPIIEKPANPYRGIVRLFVSEIEDKRWFYDREGWQKYFDMLVTHRFNHFNLSFGLSYDMSTNLTDTYTFFLYPFVLDVPGYKVRAIAKNGTPLPADEQKKNLDTLKYISDQAALRGLKFTLGIWTHSFRWTNSPNATYTIDGLDAQSMPLYSRDALRLLIDALPNVTGINLRTHGESGVAEGNYDFWKVIMAGLTGHKNADGTARTLELDLHGKSLTRELIDIAEGTGQPVIISCKLWAEHMGLPYMQTSIREAEMPKDRDATGLMAMSNGTRSLLRYGIGDLLTKDRKYKMIHRVWPGSQKLLLWGDPLYAAEYGRTGHFAGMDGIDFFEPLSFRGRAGSSIGIPAAPDRSGYADASLRAAHDWEKYRYTFRLWGRLSYNPDAKPETWQRQLQAEFGKDAAPLESALANASRILPLVTTAHDCAAAGDQYWPEMYTNQSLYNTANCPYSEAPVPKVFGNISSLDPQMFATVNEFVDSLLTGKGSGKNSPISVSNALASWSATAVADLARTASAIADPKAPAYRRLVLDATIAAGLGQFFAHKFRAAICWQLFNLSGHEPARAAARDAYKQARAAWASLADTAKVYLPNLTFGINPNLHGHWADRLPAIDADIASLATAASHPLNPVPAPAAIDALLQAVLNPIRTADERLAREHTPPASFKPGQPVPLTIRTAFDAVRLLYRHVHQGQRYVSLDMPKQGNTFTAAIPADYTNSPFPLQYYFELRNAGTAQMHPGFQDNFTGEPYYVIKPD
jgi:hypothetical protein